MGFELVKLISIILGYVLASISVGLTYPFMSGLSLIAPSASFSLDDISMVVLFTTLWALPGFVIIRGLMWYFQVENVFSFLVGGTLNGFLSTLVVWQVVLPATLFSAAVAGLVCLITERFILKKWPPKKVMDET